MRDCAPKKCWFPSCEKEICCSFCNDKKCTERCCDENINDCKFIATSNGTLINRKKPKIETKTLSYFKDNNFVNCRLEETECHMVTCCKFCERFKTCEHSCKDLPTSCKFIVKKPEIIMKKEPQKRGRKPKENNDAEY